MIELAEEDFTVKVSAETLLEDLDAELKKYEQISELDTAAELSIGEILEQNLSLNCHKLCLGLEMEHADGSISKCGGQVIKNVAGYDMAKLHIGSMGRFGKIKSAFLRTSKLMPLEMNMVANLENLDQILKLPDWKLSSAKIESSLSGHQIKYKIWGDKDLLNLRREKIIKLIPEFSSESANFTEQYFTKEYPSKKNRIEFFTSSHELYDLIKILEAELSPGERVISYPLKNQVNYYCEDMQKNCERLAARLQSSRYTAQVIAYDAKLENLINKQSEDETKILDAIALEFS